MTTYRTGNAIGSADPRDLYDNAENLDEAVNSDSSSFTDRLGKLRPTLKGAIDPTGLASSAATSAQLAEAARDAAFVNADVFPDIATGLAAVADGEQFQVVEGAEVVRYERRLDAGASDPNAVEVARYPRAEPLREVARLDGEIVVGRHIDEDGRVYPFAVVDKETSRIIAGVRDDGSVYMLGGVFTEGDGASLRDAAGRSVLEMIGGDLHVSDMQVSFQSAGALIDISDQQTGRTIFRVNKNGSVVIADLQGASAGSDGIPVHEKGELVGLSARGVAAGAMSFRLYDVNHELLYGQSLSRSTSQARPIISTEQPYNAVTLPGGPLINSRDSGWNPDPEDFAPLYEVLNESPTSSIVNGMNDRFVSEYPGEDPPVILGSSNGLGGRSVNELSPLEWGGVQRLYENMIEYVQACRRLCERKNLSYAVRCIHWFQGEADRNDHNYLHVDRLRRLKDRMSADIIKETGQEFAPFFLMYQLSSHRFYKVAGDKFGVQPAQLALAQGCDDMSISVPIYCIEKGSDGIHFDAEGAWLMGQYHARAAFETLHSHRKWEPLWPVKVAWGDSFIDIQYNPRGQLHLDDAICTLTHNMGFDIWTSDDELIEGLIAEVSVVGIDTVRITLNEPAPPGAVLTCARGRPGDPFTDGPTTGPRSNVRDSHGDVDQVVAPVSGNIYPLHNVSVMFQFSRERGFIV